jgi:hypothetical protein
MSKYKKIIFKIIEQPENNHWKDEGGKSNNLIFKIEFNNTIKFNSKDLNINILSDDLKINKFDNKKKLNYEIKQILIKSKILTIIFKIHKVCKRFDERPFKIIVTSKFFNKIESNNIYVYSKRKKNKRKNIINGEIIIYKKSKIIDNSDGINNMQKQIHILIKELISTKKALIETKKELINTKEEITSTRNELNFIKDKIEFNEFTEKINENIINNTIDYELSNFLSEDFFLP